MSQAGTPSGNLSGNPVVRKLEQKIQALEKKTQEQDQRVIGWEERLTELATSLKSSEARIASLTRQMREGIRSAPPASATNVSFAPPAHAMEGSNGSAEVFVLGTAPNPATSSNGGGPAALSTAKLDAFLSNLGIRVVQVDTDDQFNLEPINAWGAENLTQLGRRPSRMEVERFVREKEHLA
ncbi:MAG: hypothetical protein ABI743_12190 [bacterium]